LFRLHFPHKLASAPVRELVQDPKTVAALLAVMRTENVKLVQSIMFTKAGGKPGQAPHQDEAYIPTRDRSLTAVWTALEDVTVDNGGMWVIPGSHRAGVVWPLRPCDDPRYDGGTTSVGHTYEEKDWVPVLLPKGAGVIFHGYLLHKSHPNVTKGFRRSFANHYCSAETLLPWTNDGRFAIAGEGDLRDFTIVAGRDPYDGLLPRVDLLRPFLRGEEHKKRLRDSAQH
jgi:phytanoyl-CoA hydroxylase